MKCQICGCTEKRMISKLCSNMDIMGPFFDKRESAIVCCEGCGSIYVDINTDQTSFTKYYCSDYSKSLSYFEVFGYEETKTYYTNIERRIARYCEKSAKILEIGGGIGELALFLKEKGYKDITVMEPSLRCINLCKEKGINTICSDSFEIEDGLNEAFDFIIINHTLEHILDFGKTLENAYKMLKSEGHMYIEVPDAKMYVKTDFVPYWFFTYEHIVHMCIESFDNLAAAYSFKVCEKMSYLKCHSYYVMYAIFEKRIDCDTKIRYLQCLEKYIIEYIEQCEKKIKPIINEIEKRNVPVILWGVGTSTAQLLNGNFDNCNVVKLVDSNPYRQNVEYVVAGKKLKIEDPSTIDTNDMIVILPLMYDASIRKQIKKMGLINEVKSLL